MHLMVIESLICNVIGSIMIRDFHCNSFTIQYALINLDVGESMQIIVVDLSNDTVALIASLLIAPSDSQGVALWH
jgi:hypothetical protein